MKTIAMVSANGGVGKTTLVANIGAALVESGRHVVGMSLGPQNALGLHTRPAFDSQASMQRERALSSSVSASSAGASPASASSTSASSMPVAFGVDGRVSVAMRRHELTTVHLGESREAERLHYERQIEANPEWLRSHLDRLDTGGDTIVLIDTPSGRSPYLGQALAVADLVVVVVAADAMSYASLAAVQDLFANYREGHGEAYACCYVMNRFDSRRALHKDVVKVVRAALGPRVYPMPIHDDAAIGEALAYDTNVLSYRSASQASDEFRRIAGWLVERLSMTAEV